jgi:hypothetical protein
MSRVKDTQTSASLSKESLQSNEEMRTCVLVRKPQTWNLLTPERERKRSNDRA